MIKICSAMLVMALTLRAAVAQSSPEMIGQKVSLVGDALKISQMLHKDLADPTFTEKALQLARETFKDPASVTFSNVALRRKADVRYLCGMVNAKNSFGGYVGSKPFMADGISIIVQGESFLAEPIVMETYCK